jgi:hypothetical protein
VREFVSGGSNRTYTAWQRYSPNWKTDRDKGFRRDKNSQLRLKLCYVQLSREHTMIGEHQNSWRFGLGAPAEPLEMIIVILRSCDALYQSCQGAFPLRILLPDDDKPSKARAYSLFWGKCAMPLRWAYLSCQAPVTLLSVAIALPSARRLNLMVKPEIAYA